MSLLSPSPVIGTLRKVEGDGSSKDNVTNQLVDWLNEKKKRATRFLVEFFDVVCQMTSWNFQYLKFWQQSEPAAVSFTWKPFVLSKRKDTSLDPRCIKNLSLMDDVKKRRQKSQGTMKLVESLSKQATLFSPLRKPEVIISQARTVISSRFAN